MAKKDIHIALAQINLCVGDIKGNKNIIIENIRQAVKQHADIIIFPELSITGYPPEDLLLRPAFHTQVQQVLADICKESKYIDIIIGYPLLRHKEIYNSCSLIRTGSIVNTYHKQVLPNYGVFDEKRYFKSGNEIVLFDLHGVTMSLSICEDIWWSEICQQAKTLGADLMININASPYYSTKAMQREKLLRSQAQQSGLDIIYVNLSGGQDELVFDGDTMTINSHGKIIFRAPQFEQGLYMLDYSASHQDKFLPSDNYQYKVLSEEESIYLALVMGVKDYVHKNHFTSAVIGLSGGIDSALTLCIAVDALGVSNVEVLIMPSQYTATMSNEDAEKQAQKLGVKYNIIPINKAFDTFRELLNSVLTTQEATDTSEENIQARCRGVLLMAVSNKTDKIVLTTSNKSELSVGYATLYGDMAGGFSPLKDIPKTMVYKLAKWRNSEQQIIPQRVFERPPSAELSANQKDQDYLPPYEVLDQILQRYIEFDQSTVEITDAGFDAAIVEHVTRLVNQSEYKRHQAAPGVKISKRAFGRDRRYPITSAYRETQ